MRQRASFLARDLSGDVPPLGVAFEAAFARSATRQGLKVVILP